METPSEAKKEPEEVVSLHKRLVAELVGTFALVFAAAGSDVANAVSGDEIGKFAVAAAPGLVVAAMIYAVDKVSGAYFNPAVSIGFVISGHLAPKDLPLYLIAQLAGSVLASIAILFAIGQSGDAGLTLPKTDWAQSFVLELVLTFVLMFIGISLKEKVGYKPFAGVAVGAFIVAAGIIGMPISGGSMNPARSFGPAIVALNLSYQWIYWLAPIGGATLAVLCFKIIKHDKPTSDPAEGKM
jgi:MIP family channel proteins